MPSIDDIARSLGVSTATVSRALGGSRLVTAEVRTRVEAEAARIGYQKRANRRHRGRAILNVKLVLPRHSEPERALFYDLSALVEGLRSGFTLCVMNLMCEVNTHDFDPFPHKKGGDIDAFIFAFHQPSAKVQKSLRDNGTPFVVLNREIPGLSCVAMDHVAGMHEIVDHLCATQPKLQPKFITMEGLGQIHDERLNGFELACQRHEISFKRDRDVVMFANIEAIQKEALAPVIKNTNALVCVNDIVGTVVVSELDRLGVAVPEQVAVTGFDDSPVRKLSRPLLTTVSLPIGELARYTAARLQAEIIEHAPLVALLRLTGRLLVGQSTRTP